LGGGFAAGAGFTGKRALRYAGTHKADGRAYSYNKVFDVRVKVGADTELSYLVFPELNRNDLSNPASPRPPQQPRTARAAKPPPWPSGRDPGGQ